MKTVKQVMEYLNKQDWKDEFLKYAYTKLSFDEHLLDEAFEWDDTPQGVVLWSNRNQEYLDWYYSEEKVTSWEEFEKTNPAFAATPIFYMPEFVAYRKLIQLRDQWLRATNSTLSKRTCKIVCNHNKLSVYAPFDIEEFNGLSFPYGGMAMEFLNTFEDLLKIAKPLL